MPLACIRRFASLAKDSATKQASLNVSANAHRSRKIWPPDFEGLNFQQQLRFEKKFKRRINLARRMPKLQKGAKIAQLLTLAGATIWLLFYAEFEWWGGHKYKPNDELRRHITTLFGIFDPEKRYERRKDAPDYFPTREKEPGPKSESP